MAANGLDTELASGKKWWMSLRCSALQDADVKDGEVWGNHRRVVAANATQETEKIQARLEGKKEDKGRLSG